jgi:putative membrane protein
MIAKKQINRFLIRWGVNTLGLWMASRFLSGVSFGDRTRVVLIAGLILAIVNSCIRPFVMILSLPVILLTLGMFTLVVNATMVYLVHIFYSPFHVKGFGSALLAGLIVSLVNYLVTTIIEERGRAHL